MSLLEIEPVDTDKDNDDLMVHIADEDRDGFWAICGAKLHGIDADGEELDCVVCAELWMAQGGEL